MKRLSKLPEWRRLELPKIRLSTIDSVQGQEFILVIADLTKAGPDVGNIGFMRDLNRLNVMMSRAKMACVVIADSKILTQATKTSAQYIYNLKELFEGMK